LGFEGLSNSLGNPIFLKRWCTMKDRIKEIVKETLSEIDFICVEVNILVFKNNKKLKVVIYKKDGNISINDCSEVNNILRRKLDVFIPNFSENYDLIVESPGVNRKIKNLNELEIFIDREIEFFLKNNTPYNTKKTIGKVKKINGKELEIIDENNIKYKLNWDEITSAKLFFDIKKYL